MSQKGRWFLLTYLPTRAVPYRLLQFDSIRYSFPSLEVIRGGFEPQLELWRIDIHLYLTWSTYALARDTTE